MHRFDATYLLINTIFIRENIEWNTVLVKLTSWKNFMGFVSFWTISG